MAQRVLPTGDLFLIEVVVDSRDPVRIQVVVDSDHTLNIARCAEISRQLSSLIDAEQLITDAYNLEVSSPGLDQPLKLKRQYSKNVGRRIKVLVEGEEEKQGELLKVGENSILVNEEVTSNPNGKPKSNRKIGYRETLIPFDQIRQTKVLVSFKK